MNNIYDPPKSELIEQDTTEAQREAAALRKLLKEQRVVLSPIVAFFMTIVMFLGMAMQGGVAPMLVLLTPAIAVGATLKFIGRLILIKHRMVSSGTMVLAMIVVLWGWSLAKVAVIAMLSFLICLVMSARELNSEQKTLMFRWEMGKIKI